MSKKESVAAATANNVYIRSQDFAWIPARLVEQDVTTAKVAIPQYPAEEFILSDGGKGASGFKTAVIELKDYPNKSLPLQNVDKNTGSLKEVDDMCDLPYLHEVRVYSFCCDKLLYHHLGAPNGNDGYHKILHNSFPSFLSRVFLFCHSSLTMTRLYQRFRFPTLK
jgi:hypothetical protein